MHIPNACMCVGSTTFLSEQPLVVDLSDDDKAVVEEFNAQRKRKAFRVMKGGVA